MKLRLQLRTNGVIYAWWGKRLGWMLWGQVSLGNVWQGVPPRIMRGQSK